ncbi:MAG: CPBP family intramembrane metalloprotease [Thermofilaceae archaeon]|nr:CPBP family intramembrane metalloprotease [Thermofilaceae archaeon]
MDSRNLDFASRWPLPYVAFIALANFTSPELAYVVLAFSSARAVLNREGKALTPSLRGTVLSIGSVLAAQVVLVPSALFSSPRLAVFTSAVLSAVVEEVYFRGVLQHRFGILPQAFAFSLAHMRLNDPVSLVESALLTPHYFLLGVAMGLVAESNGYLVSSAAHALYNLITVTYTLPLDARVVLLLVASDAIMVSAIALPALVTLKKG